MPELSLIIPVMNEAPNIAPLSARIAAALATIDHEVIWVDDGSTDETSTMVRKYANPYTRLIQLSRNFGQSEALQAGIWNAYGKYIATIDGDGQNDPGDLPAMLELIRNNDLDMVTGVRAIRKDHFMRTIPSSIANTLIRLVTNTRLKDLGCSTRIIKREYAIRLPLNNGMHRYINVIMARSNAKIIQLPVNHYPRTAGTSKYGLTRVVPVIRDLIRIRLSISRYKIDISNDHVQEYPSSPAS